MNVNSIDYNWLALMIGNSRLHWGYFQGCIFKKAWDTPHINKEEELNNIFNTHISGLGNAQLPIYLASVVASQTSLFAKWKTATIINKQDIPINNTYSSMGIDRILALYAAEYKYGLPCLVIDCGTALTFTGINLKRDFVGGAILPGVSLQLKSLNWHTDALGDTKILDNLPPLWAKNTDDAIRSGVTYTILAGIKNFIKDWQTKFSPSKIILTGGDGVILKKYLHSYYSEIENQIIVDSDLILWGIMRLMMECRIKDSE